MALLKPFAALTPQPALAHVVCELPYDVMSTDEAREIARNNARSFLHVSKPEIDLPRGIDPHLPSVYETGAANFQNLISDGVLRSEAMAAFYLYRQVMGEHTQVGLVAAASVEEYLANVIRKHEFTRPDKEDDRVRHINALNSQTGPVFLTYRAEHTIDEFVVKRTAEPPVVDFTANDGVRHSSWTVDDSAGVQFIEQAFSRIANLYIADGHHRSAAAGRVYEARRARPGGAGESATFLAVVFPHSQMQILPYNRVLKDLNGHDVQGLLREAGAIFDIKPARSTRPKRNHELAMYLDQQWFELTVKSSVLAAMRSRIDTLDVSILQQRVLAPLFGIDDPRTSERISFVGGIRGTKELERLVNSGKYACAFSMYPTSIHDLMDIADEGGVMPPKSTWFEPKLRDGMFCHML
jgi:uncharacterized protein (DUF1015 family)